MTESILINKIYTKLNSPKGFASFGEEGDDSVEMPLDGFNESLVLSTDSFVEGTHFNHEVGYETVGWKSLVSSLSDIYAMGVQPSFYTLNLIIPKHFKEKYFDEFLEGLLKASNEYNVKIVGGDIAKGPCFIAAFQVGGYSRKGQIKSLKGVSKGDVLFTNANLGYAKLGFEDFKAEDFDSIYTKAFLRPELNKSLSTWLGSLNEVTAMTDVSDGLVREINTMLNGRSLKFQLDELTWSKDFEKACKKRKLDPEKTILEGGEEYGLLWAIKTDGIEDFLKQYKLKFKVAPFMLGNFVQSSAAEPGQEVSDRIIYHNKGVFSDLNLFSHFG